MAGGESVPNRNEALTWCVSEEKIGTMSQCTGVARYISSKEPVTKVIVPHHGIKKFFAPRPFSRQDVPPNVIISCGYRPERQVLLMKRAFAGKPLTVHLQRPEIEGYDLVFVSNHDWNRQLENRPGFHRMVGVPHRLRPADLEGRRDAARRKYKRDDQPLIAVFVGGDNGAYRYDSRSIENIAGAIDGMVRNGSRVVVSTSRRSSDATFEALNSLASPMVEVWDRRTANPYLDYVAAADGFLIAKDSITMPCEALLTGKPVYILDLTPVSGDRLGKFERFHADLRETLNLTRDFQGQIESYPYQPINEASRIGQIIAKELAHRSEPAT